MNMAHEMPIPHAPETESNWPLCSYVTEGDFESQILLPLSPGCWDYSCTPPRLAYAVPGIKPGASCMLDKGSITKVQLPTLEECFCMGMLCASIATSYVLLILHKID